MGAKEILTIVLSSGAFSALISSSIAAFSAYLQRKQERKDKADEKTDIRNQAISQILLRQIQTFGNEIIKDDSVSAEEFRQFEEMFQTYKALGGNGYADKLHEEIKRRPLTKEE